MPLRELYRIFPSLAGTNPQITSPIDWEYNCVAWVIGDNKKWYEPFGDVLPSASPPYYWPEGVPGRPNDKRFVTYVKLFESHGYRITENESVERGYTKIAIYVKDEEFRHVARQTADGKWSSKIGKQEDISHELRALETDNPYGYGTATIFMKKRE